MSLYFNPHSHAGSDFFKRCKRQFYGYFNPHSHAGSDVYQTGEFNREAVKVASGEKVGTFEDEMKKISIFLRAVQNY